MPYMWCVFIKSLLLPPYIPTNMSKTMYVLGGWPGGQELCYIELDSMMIAVKIAFCLYLILLQKRKYLVSWRYLIVTARNTRKE